MPMINGTRSHTFWLLDDEITFDIEWSFYEDDGYTAAEVSINNEEWEATIKELDPIAYEENLRRIEEQISNLEAEYTSFWARGIEKTII